MSDKVTETKSDPTDSHVCRACSLQNANETYTPLFRGSLSCKELYKDALAELLGFNLQINRDDGLPQEICSKCLNNFIFIVEFRKKCKDAQETLNASHKRIEICPVEEHITEDCNNETVKSEPGFIKDEDLMGDTKDIEEVNFDTQLFDKENGWDCEYLLDPKADVENCSEKYEADDLGHVDDTVSRIEDDSDNESDNLPLTNFVKNTKPAKRKSNSRGRKKKKMEVEVEMEDGEEKETERKKYVCEFCDKRFKMEHGLARHLKSCPKRPTGYCVVCTAEFETKESLQKHMTELHPNGGNPICPICSQTFEDAVKRDLHLRGTHGDGTKYQCEICDKAYKTKSYLKAHLGRYHSTGSYECSICHEKFTNVNKHRYHWSHAHTENMKFKCKYCEKPFATRFVMHVHERSHTGERPFLCNQCGTAFRYQTQFLDHMKRHECERNLACDICGLTFYTNRQLSNHRRKHDSKTHACEVCNEAFTYKLDLNQHKYEVHKIAKYEPKRKIDYPFNCPKCSKGFSVLTSLTKHLKVHNSDAERKHVCSHCGNGYKRSDHLKLHIKRMHLKITEHKCQVCGREYLEKCALNAHMVVHDSARPFTCTKCPASFKRQRSLRDHMLKHEGKKEYACGICDMRFFNRTIVVLHTKRVHSDFQKQFMSELVLKEFEESTAKEDEIDEPIEGMKEELINVNV